MRAAVQETAPALAGEVSLGIRERAVHDDVAHAARETMRLRVGGGVGEAFRVKHGEVRVCTGVQHAAVTQTEHLRRQRRWLAATSPRPIAHVVVNMGDPALPGVLAADDPGCRTLVVDVPGDPMPLSAARNAGDPGLCG